jgi:hypothetical protein
MVHSSPPSTSAEPRVDLLVLTDDGVRGVGIAGRQRRQGLVELRLHNLADGDQPRLQRRQLPVERRPHAFASFPNRSLGPCRHDLRLQGGKHWLPCRRAGKQGLTPRHR